jgi:molybdopterin-containing oxidoreductase family iron-sulfur binding subunit
MSVKANTSNPLDFSALRAKLAARGGRDYWRGLEELAQTPEFREYLHREFPEQASEWNDGLSRRNFLKLMAASLALAGVTACTKQPAENIVPYVHPPEHFIPGKPLFYATALTLGGFARGVLVESHLGRPTKIEGNSLHPAGLGATDAFMQAAILTLYDPDRSRAVTEAGRISTWSAFLTAATRALRSRQAQNGRGIRILTETVTSPTLAHQLREFLKTYPEAKWHQYEPVGRENVRAGSQLAFGELVETHYRIEKAHVILSLESDFLCSGPAHLRYAREFAARRRESAGTMNRLYAVESTPTNTGAMADHRLPLRAAHVGLFAREIARRLGVASDAAVPAGLFSDQTRWFDALARDLQKLRGACLVIPGEHQPASVHALAHALNHSLGNAGRTVVYTDPVEAEPVDQMASLAELVTEMDAGRVEVLFILGGNPVYNAPADLEFAQRISKVPLRAHLSLYEDETSDLCHWHIPEAHTLEAWGDARAFDGTVTIQQPLIAPLYGGKSAHEFLSALAGEPARSGYNTLRDFWRPRAAGKDFETFWRTTVHDGVMEGSALQERTVNFRPQFLSTLFSTDARPQPPGFEVVFRPDPTVFDGRFANNGWLQELPKPGTRLTWDNVALVAPRTAERQGLKSEDVVELRLNGRTVAAPVWVMPGQAEDSVTVFLGYGRRRAGRVGSRIGYDAYALRTTAAPWFAPGLTLQPTGRRYRLAGTQVHHSMEGRDLVRSARAQEFEANPDLIQQMGQAPTPGLSLYPQHEYPGYAWGMAIDLNACVGCGACVVACQSENNVPIVGKDQVLVSREMHWLRVDRYFKGDLDNPEIHHQPVPCMHCENAPCEVVCPVAATVHSDEGLNDMVYNRCVGTRYCSNNCPYKVRRFNFLQYADHTQPSLKLMRNPNVTVRSRGVMEKCTYCVQRINAARITAEKEDRKVRDGEIATACQAACPTQAIVFGDINDPNSRVAKLKAGKRNYGLLAELNTRPRTTYLAKLRNPNPEIEES